MSRLLAFIIVLTPNHILCDIPSALFIPLCTTQASIADDSASNGRIEFLKAKLRENESALISIQCTVEIKSDFQKWYREGLSDPILSANVTWAEDIRKGWIFWDTTQHLASGKLLREVKAFDGVAASHSLYPDGKSLHQLVQKSGMLPEIRLIESPLWLTGQRIDGMEASLSQLIDQAINVKLVEQTVDGIEFEGLAFEYAVKAPNRRIVVLMDSEHQYLPRRIEISSSGRIRYISQVNEFDAVDSVRTGQTLFFPKRGILERHSKERVAFTKDFTIHEAEVNKDLNVEDFRVNVDSLPAGVHVVDGIRGRSFIVGGRKDIYQSKAEEFYPNAAVEHSNGIGSVVAVPNAPRIWLFRGGLLLVGVALLLSGFILKRARKS